MDNLLIKNFLQRKKKSKIEPGIQRALAVIGFVRGHTNLE